MVALKLDYDCGKDELLRRFSNGLKAIRRVQLSKMPETLKLLIHVTEVKATRKGYHVCIHYVDDIALNGSGANNQIQLEPAIKYYIVNLQTILGSDITRSFFDARRIYKGEKVYNLLFDYKSGQQFVADAHLQKELNCMIDKVFYNGANSD
jgi:hypothetical protein